MFFVLAVGLFEAWKLWISGNIQNSMLWGMEILWWGRMGKLFQFAAALAIIAEIIGPDRLRIFGNSLHETFTCKKAVALLTDSKQWIKTMWRYKSSSGEEQNKALAETSKYKADNVNLLVCLFATVITLYLLWEYLDWWMIIILAIISYSLFLITISPILTVFVILFFSGIGALVDFILIEPLAWCLERKHIDKWVKIISVILLIVGFHFDLLAS